MLFLLAFFLFSLFTFNANANESFNLRLTHRVVHPNLPVTPWSELGIVAIPPVVSIQPNGSHVSLSLSESFKDDLVDFASAVHPNKQGAMYHVAFNRYHSEDTPWVVSSMKACLLPSSTSANIVIHFSLTGEPFAIDYTVSPVPQGGICAESSAGNYPAHNPNVVLKSPRIPPLPELRAPPPLTPQGEPIPLVPEKSFVQKYWIYMVVILGALLITGPAEETSDADAKGGK